MRGNETPDLVRVLMGNVKFPIPMRGNENVEAKPEGIGAGSFRSP